MFNVLKVFRELFGPWVAAAPPRPKPRPTIKLRLEELEKRWCPANPATDTFIWDPQSGANSNPAQAANWFDQATNATATAAPSATNPIVLSGSKSAYNQSITFSQAMSVASITVQNGYNNTLTINNGATFTVSGNSAVQSGCNLTFFSGGSGISLTNGADFYVNAGGTVSLQDGLGVIVGGTFFSSGDQGSEDVVNNGTLSWIGTPGSTTSLGKQDDISVPVANSGTFNASGGGISGTIYPGRLYIAGEYSAAHPVSFYQTAGSFNITNLAQVTVASGYDQWGGSLNTDATPATTVSGYFDLLRAGLNGDGNIYINGGNVDVDTTANSYGTLNFFAGTVVIYGEIDVTGLTQQNGNSKLSDLLNCGTATVTLGTSSYLNLSTTGTYPLGTGNQWTVMQYGSITGNWGSQTFPTGMTVTTGTTYVKATN